MQKHIIKTTYERMYPMDDVLVPHRSVIIRGSVRNPKMLSILVVGLILSVSFVGAKSHGTISYFSDIDTSAGNSFTADPLFFSVAGGPTEQTFTGVEMNTNAPIVVTTTLGEGSEPVQYHVRAEKTAGSDPFCNALTVLGDSPLAFNGPLVFLNTATTSVMGAWDLFVSLPDTTGVSDGDSCSIDLVYTGWNDGVPEGNGYTDSHRVPLVFHFIAPVNSARAAADISPTPALPSATAASTTPTNSVDMGGGEAPSAATSSPQEQQDAPSDPPFDTTSTTTEDVAPPPPPSETLPSATPPVDTAPADTSTQ